MLNTKNTDYNSIKNFGGLETGIKLNKSEILFTTVLISFISLALTLLISAIEVSSYKSTLFV